MTAYAIVVATVAGTTFLAYLVGTYLSKRDQRRLNIQRRLGILEEVS